MALAGERTIHPSIALTASATLEASGAYPADPTETIAVPSGALRAMISIKYTRGGAGGKAAHKVFRSARKDGTNTDHIAQAQAADGSYDGTEGRASTSASAIWYSLDVSVEGCNGIAMISAEVGAKGSPGTVEAWVSFQ